jgi:long-chain acyl-CoA synthetase
MPALNLDPTETSYPWLRHYDSSVPPHLEYPTDSLGQAFAFSARRYRDRPALDFLGTTLTYAELEDAARKLAAYLKQRGVGVGDRVLLLLPNMPQFVVAGFAIHLIGAVIVPASPLDTAGEVEYKARNSGARFIIFLDLLYDCVRGLRESRSAGENLLGMLSVDIADYLPFLKRQVFRIKKRFLGRALPDYDGARPVCLERYGAVLRRSETLPDTRDARVDSNSLAVILYTGGTTGVSKGVMLTHRALMVNCTQGRRWVGFNESDVILCVLPFFHGFGMSMGMHVGLISGARLILMPKFDAGAVLKHLVRDGVTMFAAVPTMYISLVHHPDFARLKHSRLRGSFVGAAPVPESLKQLFQERTGAVLIEGYGLTETVTANCAAPYEQARRGATPEKSIGIPWPDTEFKIVDPEDPSRELPVDAPGELLVRTPAMMAGYWQNEAATSECLRDGWLHTGDICTRDADGYFYIVDRKKDLIISGGFNVYPTEIEEVLYQHKAIRHACVLGVADEFFGEVPKAFVTLHDGKTLNADELRDFLKERLIKYKVPRHFEFRDELPLSPIGKVLRKQLRADSLRRSTMAGAERGQAKRGDDARG